MSVADTISINDGESTPVQHDFVVSRVSPELSIFQDRSPGLISAFNIVSIGTRYASSRNNGQKVTFKLELPTMDTEVPTTVAHKNYFEATFSISHSATLQERKNLLALARNLLADSVATDSVESLSPPY